MKSIWEKKPVFGKMRIKANTSDRMKKKLGKNVRSEELIE